MIYYLKVMNKSGKEIYLILNEWYLDQNGGLVCQRNTKKE